MVEVSLKVTFSGTVPDTGVLVKVKFATGFITEAAATGLIGAVATVIYFVRVTMLVPAAFLAVSATV